MYKGVHVRMALAACGVQRWMFERLLLRCMLSATAAAAAAEESSHFLDFSHLSLPLPLSPLRSRVVLHLWRIKFHLQNGSAQLHGCIVHLHIVASSLIGSRRHTDIKRFPVSSGSVVQFLHLRLTSNCL